MRTPLTALFLMIGMVGCAAEASDEPATDTGALVGGAHDARWAASG